MTPSQGRSTCDVAIVGSGPVGTAIARELSDAEPSTRIIVLEAGPVLGEVPGGHLRNIADVEARDAALALLSPGAEIVPGGSEARPGTALLGTADMPNAAISTNVGGMGAHWTAACPRPAGDEVPDGIDAHVLDAAFVRAEELLSVTTRAFDGAPLIDVVRGILGEMFDRSGRRPVGPMPVAAAPGTSGALRWSGPSVIAGDLWTRPHVELRARTLARRILMHDDQVTGLETVDMATGATAIIEADTVVVAADAFRTPQLLWASGVRPRALGRYLVEHPQVVAASMLDERHLSPPGCADAGGVAAESSAPAGTIIPVTGVSWVPFATDRPFHGQVMQLDASPVPLDTNDDVRPGQVVGLGWFCQQEISPANRVWFDEEHTDQLGMPSIRIDYALSTRDKATIAAAVEEIGTTAHALGRPLADPRVLPPGSSLHYLGTTRMGAADDGTSVCDRAGEVWGTRNLYVGGNNVIPTATACNPTLTAVALGVITARAIATARAGQEPM